MKNSTPGRILIFCLACYISGGTVAGQHTVPASMTPWYMSLLNLPKLQPSPVGQPVIIAVVDDGFRLTHKRLEPFWIRSSAEEAVNRLDDDGNGYADDYCGWDVADGDNDPSLPEGRESTFYHGTFLTGLIADILTLTYGKDASDLFKILPVKAIPDAARQTYLSHGYDGVGYALAANADIILCAWNGGAIGQEEARLFENARKKEVLVVAAAGNFYSEQADPPASDPRVVAVAAVDSLLRKTPESNYGQFIDFIGPGQGVIGTGSLSDQELVRSDDGASSAASAAIAACLAILRRQTPEASAEDLIAAMKNTSLPSDNKNRQYAGKLGSGFPDIQRALAYLNNAGECCEPFSSGLPEGSLTEQHLRQDFDGQSFTILPAGQFQGAWFEFSSVPSADNSHSRLAFYTLADSVVGTIALQAKERIFVPGNGAKILWQAGSNRRPDFQLDYYMETIDSSTLFCRDIKIYENTSGTFTDGSGAQNYANASNCQWQIIAPPGYRIRLKFPEFDTQARTDFVYLFDGTSTIPENMIARFSGPDIPPEVISRTNEVLVWFVTDPQISGKGWQLEYQWVQ